MAEYTPSILWFQDGIKLRSPEHQWEKIDLLTQRLVSLVGRPDFKHQVIFPEDCIRRIERPLSLTPDNTIIDLTSSFGQRRTDLLPDIPVVGRFRLSRIRNVLSPRLDRCGFLISMSPQEIARLKSLVSFANPILIDDVAWSGRTALEAINILGLNPPNTTFVALALNEGDFGEGKPGAANLLTKKGVEELIAGKLIRTPEQDGFHLADFFEHRTLADKEVFGVIIRIQTLRELLISSDETGRKGIEREIKLLLAEHSQVLFPNAKGFEEMKKLEEEERLVINGGLAKAGLFDVNPPNWLMPSFSRRASSQMLALNADSIVDVLKRFNDILNLRRFL